MKALYTTTLWIEVKDEDEAELHRVRMEYGSRNELFGKLNQVGADVEFAKGSLGFLGTNMYLIDEQKVL